jgi:hypothetical protein
VIGNHWQASTMPSAMSSDSKISLLTILTSPEAIRQAQALHCPAARGRRVEPLVEQQVQQFGLPRPGEGVFLAIQFDARTGRVPESSMGATAALNGLPVSDTNRSTCTCRRGNSSSLSACRAASMNGPGPQMNVSYPA